MAVFAFVFLAPIGYAIYLSFFRTKLIGGTSFVGLENYQNVFTDSQFWSSFGRVALFLCVQVPIMLFLALLAALAIDSGRLYGKSFFRVTIFMPYAVPAVVATLMWGFMYGPQFGLIGNINDAFGWSLPNPLGPGWLLASIGNIVTWEFVGYNMLIFYSALQVIPRTLYEAAELDGAGQVRIIRSIKLPAIRGALLIATIFSIIGTFQLFNEPAILKSLAPNVITTYYTPNMYAYSLSFAGQQFNYSAAVAIVMALLTAIVAYAVQLRGLRKERVQ
nr:sugar ABC transporter permease [Hamadaea sp.]